MFDKLIAKLKTFSKRDWFVLIVLVLIAGSILFGDSKASLIAAGDQHPQYLGADHNGYHFKVKGQPWMCRTLGDGRVWCITKNDVQYMCVFQSPPVYFNNCELHGTKQS